MILVVNLGLKSIRAIIFDENGRRVATSAQRVNSRLVGDCVEQDATEWTEKLHQVIRGALDSVSTNGAIRYVTVSCSASCLIAVDENLSPVGHVIMVSDKRAVDQGHRIAALPEMQRLASKYGYSASQYSQLARMLWLKEQKPELHARTHKYLAPNDFLIALLTGGKLVTDTLNAEKNFFDTEAGTYPSELNGAIGLPTNLLPDVVDIGTNIGPMDKALAASLNMKSCPDIVVGTYDAICSVFGTGVCSAGQICDVSGTVTSVRMYSDKPFVDLQSRVMSQHFPPSNGYLIGGSNNLGGGLIEWAKACLYKEVPNPYELMQTESTSADFEAKSHTGIVFLPHLLGARAPSWNADARGVFFGLERSHSRGDIMRAIFESIGYSIKDFLAVFEESETKPEIVTASGGLANLAIANEIKATITGLPYHLMDEFESTSLGAAIIVMCSVGVFPSYKDACADIVAARQIFLPRRDDQAYYEDMYGLYRDLMKSVEPQFDRRRDIMAKHSSKAIEYVENL